MKDESANRQLFSKWSPKTFILLGAIGIGLIVLNLGGPPPRNDIFGDQAGADQSSSGSGSTHASTVPQDGLERQLENVLSAIPGVSRVDVMITYARSAETVYAQDITRRVIESETAGQQGTAGSRSAEINDQRNPTVLRMDAGRSEDALVRYTISPEIAGVLVVAGLLPHGPAVQTLRDVHVEEERLRYVLLNAVATGLDIPPHRVEILIHWEGY